MGNAGFTGPPVAIRYSVGPVHADHRLLRVVEARVGPPRRRCGRGRRQEPRVLLVRDGRSTDDEGVGEDAMARTLVRMPIVPAHPEPAGRDRHHVHAVEYNQVLTSTPWRDDMNVAERMSRLGTESAFEVLARAKALERQGKEIIHLEIGEPDFDTPAHIREAAKRALDGGATHYGPAAGLPELREAIAKDVGATRNIPVNPDEIVVTPGAKPIMYFVITALVNPGDEVIYPNPGFPIYESVINFVG